jgi:hypothetical protein
LKIKCPHCELDIDVVSAGELRDEFGINSNRLQHAKSKNRFPDPWLSFPNRDVWIRDDIVSYVSKGTVEATENAVETLKNALAAAGPEEAEKLLDELRASLRS